MGARGDSVWQETGLIESFPKAGPPALWRQKIGSGYSGPAVIGNKLYLMDRLADVDKEIAVENNIRAAGELPGKERVLCLDTETGKTLWSHPYDCNYSIAYPTGPRCTPTIDGNRVYTLGAMGDLICFERHTGKVIWKDRLTESFATKPPLWGFASHPLVDGPRLIVPVGGAGSAVVAFDKQTGKLLWKSSTTADVAYAPLVIYEKDGERQLIFWHGEGISSLNPRTGDPYWTVKFPEEPNPSVVSIATPRLIGNQLLISEFYKGSLLLELESNPPKAREIWRSQRKDPRNKETLNSVMTTPMIKNGHAFGIANNARGQGIFRCIELATGKLKWTKEDWLADRPLAFATAFIVENEDRYLLFADTGELLIAQFNHEGFKEITRATILEPTSNARGRRVVWSHPAFADGRMYARNDHELVCIDLRSPKK